MNVLLLRQRYSDNEVKYVWLPPSVPLFYDLGFSSNRTISCDCLSWPWLLSEPNQPLLTEPAEIKLSKGESSASGRLRGLRGGERSENRATSVGRQCHPVHRPDAGPGLSPGR